MSSCFRCGKALPDGQVECDPACDEAATDHENNVQKLLAYMRSQAYPIDWDKVSCFADLKLIIETFWCNARVSPGTPEFRALKHLLKDS